MASLKEVKGRISSITSIWKITSAMRMVASAKLHRALNAMGNMIPYQERLQEMLSSLLLAGDMNASPYARTREVTRVAIVAFSSNSSLAGAFNANIIKKFHSTVAESYPGLAKENILVFPVGRKIHDAAIRAGYTPQGDFQNMSDKPNSAQAAELAQRLMEMFRKHEVDRVEIIYNHYHSMASQITTREVYLPITTEQERKMESAGTWKVTPDFILEPGQDELIDALVPKVLGLKIYTTLLDSAVAEYAARTVAMQIATDNADELLDQLTKLYNKSRQQAITAELLDITGSSAAR